MGGTGGDYSTNFSIQIPVKIMGRIRNFYFELLKFGIITIATEKKRLTIYSVLVLSSRYMHSIHTIFTLYTHFDSVYIVCI